VSILFGHPTGNPNSHHAGLAHFEAGRLEAFCVPWMPTLRELSLLRRLPIHRKWAVRVERRSFLPLLTARRCEGRVQEWKRLVKRAVFPNYFSTEALAWEANDWLMSKMAEELRRRPKVTAVHSFEDCSLTQFQEAKRSDRACIYDMPIGYYPAWQELQAQLAKRFADWLPADGLPSIYSRPQQKREEMELADLVLVPSSFVARTIQRFTDKKCALAPYGVDSAFWRPSNTTSADQPLRFLYAGQLSIRKGIPMLIEAWKRANRIDAELHLVGSWLLAPQMRRQLPSNVRYFKPCSQTELRGHYQSADVFVFPSFFEGLALVLLEAMACGLPIIASDASGALDIADNTTGRIFPAGDMDALTNALIEVANHRDRLAEMKIAARQNACRYEWSNYRKTVSAAVKPFC
jgi:glycosyltransferase involved in cell wall biosynthesis